MRKILAAALCVATLVFAALFQVSCEENRALDKYFAKIKFDGQKITGRVEYFFGSDYDGRVAFNLYANAYREGAKYPAVSPAEEDRAFFSGKSYGGISVQNAYISDTPVNFEVSGEDMNMLVIAAPPLKKGESVAFDFTAEIPYARTRMGVNGDKVNLGDLLPAFAAEGKESLYCTYGDPYRLESCDYEVCFTLPSVYVVASSGNPASTVVDGEYTTYGYTLSGGRDFAFVLGKNFSVARKTVGKIEVDYFSDEQSEKMAGLAANCIEYFNNTFGDYIYDRFSAAETGFIEGGMEYSGLVFIAEDGDEEQKEISLIHETAHQWWHAAVGNDQIDYAWIDEGLAQYSTYLYLDENGFKEMAEDMLASAKSGYKSFFGLVETLKGEKNTTMNRSLNEFSGKYEYVNIAYNKPLIMFTEYEKAAGRDKTKKRLKKLYRENIYKNISPDDIIKYLGYEDFFRSYFDGKVMI